MENDMREKIKIMIVSILAFPAIIAWMVLFPEAEDEHPVRGLN